MTYKVSIVIEKDEFGYYAYCPDLVGCQTQGATLDETLANTEEAVALYLETLTPDAIKTSLSRQILTTAIKGNCSSFILHPSSFIPHFDVLCL